MAKIGITGGIGSGKTLVTDYLRHLGAKVICADEITHMLYRPGKAGALAVAEAFGDKYVNEKGVDREKLRSLVFSDKNALDKLNSLLHPMIFETFIHAASHQRLVFFDAALLIETGWHQGMDEVWLIIANIEARIERIKQSRGLDEAQIKNIISSQMTDAEKMQYAHHVIDNSGDQMDTYCQINGLYIRLNQRLNGLIAR